MKERGEKSDISAFSTPASYRKIYWFIYYIKNNNIPSTDLNCHSLDLIFVTTKKEKLCFLFGDISPLRRRRCHFAAICRTLIEAVKIAISKLMYQQHINKLFHFSNSLSRSIRLSIYKIISSNKLIETIHAWNRKFLSRCLALLGRDYLKRERDEEWTALASAANFPSPSSIYHEHSGKSSSYVTTKIEISNVYWW